MRTKKKLLIVLTAALTLALALPVIGQASIDQAKNRAYTVLNTFETLGYSFRETAQYGALERGQYHTFSTTLFQGSTYAIIVGGDHRVSDIDVKVYDENGVLVARDQDVQPAAVARVTPLWSGTFYVRVIMKNSDALANWYVLIGQAPAPRVRRPAPGPDVAEYFVPEWRAPSTAEAIAAFYRPVWEAPPDEFVVDRFGRTRYSAAASVHFAKNSAEIEPQSVPLLNEWGEALRGPLRRGVFMVEGHTSSTGKADYNQTLSERRAQSVVDFLVYNWGISPTRLIPRGFGERFPIASNATEAGRARNRRVQFTLIDWID
jgi:outer membrane protein OmpA-like peptidoglycan-associated protein